MTAKLSFARQNADRHPLKFQVQIGNQTEKNSQPDTENIYKIDPFVKMKRQARPARLAFSTCEIG
jgi:hypothetical protein